MDAVTIHHLLIFASLGLLSISMYFLLLSVRLPGLLSVLSSAAIINVLPLLLVMPRYSGFIVVIGGCIALVALGIGVFTWLRRIRRSRELREFVPKFFSIARVCLGLAICPLLPFVFNVI